MVWWHFGKRNKKAGFMTSRRAERASKRARGVEAMGVKGMPGGGSSKAHERQCELKIVAVAGG